MSISIDELFNGYNQIETVTVLNLEKRVVEGKPALIVQAEHDGKAVKFGVLGDGLEAFAKNCDKIDNKIQAKVPAQFLTDGKKIKWVNTPY